MSPEAREPPRHPEAPGEAPALTNLEAAVLEQMSDLRDRNPDLYRQVLNESIEEEQKEEHGTALLSTLENAGTLRQEQDQALIDAVFRGTQESSAGEADES